MLLVTYSVRRRFSPLIFRGIQITTCQSRYSLCKAKTGTPNEISDPNALLIAECSKALPLAARRLSPMCEFESGAGQCEKVARDLGGLGFAWYSGFHHYLQLACQDLALIWQKK